jgi:hypothetical protein
LEHGTFLEGSLDPAFLLSRDARHGHQPKAVGPTVGKADGVDQALRKRHVSDTHRPEEAADHQGVHQTTEPMDP